MQRHDGWNSVLRVQSEVRVALTLRDSTRDTGGTARALCFRAALGVIAMRRTCGRAIFLLLFSVGVFFLGGCPAGIKRSAVQAISAQIQPPDPALAKRLESAGNPTGQGVVVFVRGQTGCAPLHTWIWVNDESPSYALDEASRRLTPRLSMLHEAPATTLARIGSEPDMLAKAVRDSLCQRAQR